MLLEPGKYVAKVGEINGNKIVVYEATTGSLCAAIPCEVCEGDDAGKVIKHTVTMVNKDGAIQTRTNDTLKEVFGWDGLDPFWLMDADLSEVTFEIVIESETTDKGTFSKVKWLNPLGGGQKMPETADRRSVLAKYGSKFRALSTAAKPAPASAPAKPATKPAPALPKKSTAPPPQSGPTATMEECWEEMCKANDGKSQDDLATLWFATLKEMFGTDNNSDITPQQWGQLKPKLGDYVPM